MKILPEMYL